LTHYTILTKIDNAQYLAPSITLSNLRALFCAQYKYKTPRICLNHTAGKKLGHGQPEITAKNEMTSEHREKRDCSAAVFELK
jgi:hypothetical protein